MGRADKTTKNNALAVQVDGDGKVKYDAIARLGHTEGRVIHTSFKDLIPLRQRAEAGDINLERPSQEEVEATAERTRNALAKLVNGAVAAQKPKTLAAMGERKEATYVRYTPASQMGDTSQKADRVMKIVERQRVSFFVLCSQVHLLTLFVGSSGTPKVQTQEDPTRA